MSRSSRSSRARRPEWRNWAGNQHAQPRRVERPRDEASLVAVVRRAADEGLRVKPVGAGHSFSAIACTDGVLVDLSGYDGVLGLDRAAGTVTVEAGITLSRLNEELALRNLALENLGDIAYQSISGATATGTHGTGIRFGNLATQIAGMRLVVGDGSVVELSESRDPEALAAARVSLGALGVVSTVTLRCVPAFNLHAVERTEPLDEVMAAWEENVRGNDHFELYWIPHTGIALTKRNRRTTEPPRPRAPRQALWEDYVVSNLGLEVLCRIGRWRPSLVPAVARRLPSARPVDQIDASYRVFASPRHVRFVEMEYAIALEAVPEAVERVRRLVERIGLSVHFPVEVRAVAADDIALSPASGRETGYIACHAYRGSPHDQYFQGVEAIMDDYGGRPHWGKMHFQRAETLAPRYPRWDRFQALRARMDPEGRFANPYLERVLGTTSG